MNLPPSPDAHLGVNLIGCYAWRNARPRFSPSSYLVNPLTVIIPTLNEAQRLPLALKNLRAPTEAKRLIAEIIVADARSRDQTRLIAKKMGARIIITKKGRGTQMREAAQSAKTPWLFFLHADCLPQKGWAEEAAAFIKRDRENKDRDRAAVFRFALESPRRKARLLEALVALRCRLLKLPYGDQGLLIEKRFYDEIGGFADIPLMEDVALVRKIPRHRLCLLKTALLSSARRYEGGFFARIFKNQLCLALYFLGVPPKRIADLYER